MFQLLVTHLGTVTYLWNIFFTNMKTLDTLQLASSLSIFCKQCQCDFLEDSFVFILVAALNAPPEVCQKKGFFSTSALARTYVLLVG